MDELISRDICLFDGLFLNLSEMDFDVRITGVQIADFRFSDLRCISKIRESICGVEPEEISMGLGFKVKEYAEIKIYYGSKQGLKLHFVEKDIGPEKIILLISFGEFQPSRYVCQLNGYFCL
ncbi:MAG: hypothetical protein K6L73_10980 [Cellvibrionaceae bacterium]